MSPSWAIFISGRGSNAQALLDVIDEVPVSLVVSSRGDVWGLRRAERAGVPVLVLDKKVDWQALLHELDRHRISHIFLLGFMKLIPPEFLRGWMGKIYNLHPSLLPQFPGMHAIEKSFEAGQQMGVTVHAVTEEMDAGERCLQKVTLKKASLVEFDWAQILISRDEQRLVREWAWRQSRTAAQERTQKWLV